MPQTSSSVKRAAGEALAAYLATAVPALAGNVHVGAADPSQKWVCPTLQIIPHKHSFEPYQQDEEYNDPDDTTLVINVGELVGKFELRIAAGPQVEREELEAAVLAALCPDDDSPGVVVVDLPGVKIAGTTTTVTGHASFDLGDGDWQEEMAWSEKRFSFIELESQLQMLTLRTNVPTIEQLLVELTQNMDDEIENIPADQIETVQVNQDGTITEQ
jgi:hypothetical protein